MKVCENLLIENKELSEKMKGKTMRNIKLIIEYDGKKFGGWQKQPNKLNIQGEIEQAIKEITGEQVELNASRKN